MDTVKLAYLASEYPGISHTFIFREIHGLRDLGFEVSTASIRRPANLSKMTKAEKQDAAETLYIKETSMVKVVKIHWGLFWRNPKQYLEMASASWRLSRRGPRSLFKGLAYLAEAGILLHWLHRQDIRHIHVHFGNPAATVALIASFYGTIDYSLSIHGPDIFYDVTINLLPEKIKNATFVRCISHYCQSQLMRLVPYEYWSRLNIVRCGVDLEIFETRPNPHNAIPEILCVGRLVPAKGQHILVAAVGRLKTAGVPCHLTLVGGGEDLESLQALAQKLEINDQIAFVGAVGQEEVHGYYNQADIFVLASFAEGVPVVLMEAMAKEIPCISTRITGIPELIETGVDGILVTPGNIDELSEILAKLLLDPDLRQELGPCGRRKIQTLYNLPVNCQGMTDLFKKFLGIGEGS
jgi:colanic acid/amylovoran biosynthesis glycosyltransferase